MRAMITLLLAFSIFQFAWCSCPEGFDLVHNGQCREMQPVATATGSSNGEVVDTAIAACSEIRAQPVIIHNDEEQAYWKGRVSDDSDILLGITCNTKSKKWEWADGSATDYTPHEGLRHGSFFERCSTGCVWSLVHAGHWDKVCFDSEQLLDIFCISQLHQPVLPADGCYEFEDDGEDGVCYQIGTKSESWADAQLNCKKFGADLATIHNDNENSFVRRLAVSNGAVHDIFLGAKANGGAGEYGWVDGSEWDYDNFAPGFPKSGFGDCIVMDTSTTSGQWMNMDCTAQTPVACARQPKPVEVNVACSTDPWKEGTLITSPGFPFNATMPCEYYLMADAGKRVEVQINFLEANSCCDFLTIYDGYAGGFVLANLTGEVGNATYTTTSSNIMRVTWNPTDGMNVMGMAMTFRGV